MATAPALTARICKKCGASFVTAKCKPCRAAYMREWYAANPARAKAIAVKTYLKNRVKRNAISKQWRLDNPEAVAAHWKAFHERNAAQEKEWNRAKRQRNKEKIRQTARLYHEARPGLKNLWDANRRANEKQATPAWANSFFMAEAYHLAKLREKVCGGKWHVDHIVPIQGRTVCGLHVEHNLQVIPWTENLSKSNRYWPDMP